MNFLFPSFLYALSAISIPIVIHLFNFRRYKKLYFSNVRFLKEVVQESRSKSKIRQFLVLLCRILVVGFLVLAFAQPFIPTKQGITTSGAKAVSIFIDNSFSMNALNKNGTLLDDAKQKAETIAKSLNPADKVQMVSQDFDAVQERWLNKDEFLSELKGLKISSSSRMLGEVMERQQDNLMHSGCPVKEAFVISDFQKSVSVLSSFKPETGMTEGILPVAAETKSNISVDTCWFSSPVHIPGKPEDIFVKLSNYSPSEVTDKPIKVFVNGIEKATGSFGIAPNSSTILSLSYVPDKSVLQQGVIKISDYPITFDDNLFFSYRISTRIPVLRVYSDSIESGNALRFLFGKDSGFSYTEATINQLDYATLPLYQLIILDEAPNISSGLSHELTRYLTKGGNLLIIPASKDLDKDSYNQFLSSVNCPSIENIDTTKLRVDKLNYESMIYSGVFEKSGDKKENRRLDLPLVNRHYRFSHNSSAVVENLMKLDNGDDFLDMFHYAKSRIYLLAVSFDDAFSNLKKHAIFVPTFYNIGLYSALQQPLYYTIGNEQPIEAPEVNLPEGTVFKITSDSNNFTFLPEKRTVNDKTLLFLHNQVSLSGNYKLFAADSVCSVFSFNYDRKESPMSFLSEKGLDSLCTNAGIKNFKVFPVAETQNFASLLSEVNRGEFYWKYCILLALLFLAVEVALLRLWKE